MEMTELINKQQTDKRQTPQKFFDILNDYHGYDFTLDPCATDKSAKCEKYFTPEDDGLNKSWQGESVFCNPPYSEVSQWMNKCNNEGSDPNTLVAALVFSRTSTKWWHNYAMRSDEIHFVERRIKYDGLKNNAPAPSCLVVWTMGELSEGNPEIYSMGQP